MKNRAVVNGRRFGAIALSAMLIAGGSWAAEFSADSLKLAPGVTKAMEGYEAPATTYIVANPTSVYSDHSYFDDKVTGNLKRGEHVEALAKVKDYDWILVGRNGVGFGYVPISMLSPADQYHP